MLSHLVDLFGVPLYLEGKQAASICRDLETYAAAAGHDLRTAAGRQGLDHFLQDLCDPRRKQGKVRQLVRGVAPVTLVPESAYTDQLLHRLTPHRSITSFEGLAVYELLAERTTDDVTITSSEAARALAYVHSRHVPSSLFRLHDVTDLLLGSKKSMRPQALAVLMIFLLNRNTDPARPLPRTPGRLLNAVDEALYGSILGIGRLINPDMKEPERTKDWSLNGGWPYSQAAKHLLSPALEVTKCFFPGETEEMEGVYLSPERVEDAKAVIGRQLALRSLGSDDTIDVLAAVTGVFERETRPMLLQHGLAFDEPVATRRLVKELSEQWAAGRGDSGS